MPPTVNIQTIYLTCKVEHQRLFHALVGDKTWGGVGRTNERSRCPNNTVLYKNEMVPSEDPRLIMTPTNSKSSDKTNANTSPQWQ